MKSWLLVIFLLGVIGGGVGYYYTTTQARLQAFAEKTATLEANNQRLVEVNQQNLNVIDELNEAFDEVRRNFEQVQSEFQVIRSQNNELRERLGRHELGALAAAKPSLVERTINRASDSAARCFELLSGAPLTESERNARSEREFNPECPWLWSGNN
jgi:regulator of replication initiation timing